MINNNSKVYLTISMEDSHRPRSDEYVGAVQYIKLGYAFIESAISRPPKSHPKKHKDMIRRWNKMDDISKLKINCDDLANSLGGELVSFELL